MKSSYHRYCIMCILHILTFLSIRSFANTVLIFICFVSMSIQKLLFVLNFPILKYVNIFFDSCQNFCLIFLKVIDLSVIAELFQKFKKNFSTFPISGFNFWCSFDRSPSFFFLQIKICCASTVCELIFLLSLNPVRTSDIYFSYILGLFQIHVLWKMPVS